MPWEHQSLPWSQQSLPMDPRLSTFYLGLRLGGWQAGWVGGARPKPYETPKPDEMCRAS